MPRELVSEDVAGRAVGFLGEVLDHERQVFPTRVWIVDGKYRTDFSSREDVLRYSITCFLGLRAASRGRYAREHWLNRIEARVESFVRGESSAVTRPSDLGLLLVLTAPNADLRVHSTSSIRRLRRVVASTGRHELNVQDLSWMLWGAADAARGGLPGAHALAACVYDRLVRDYVEPASALPEHRPVWWRQHLVSFGGLSYYLRAIHEYSVLTREEGPRELFWRGVQAALEVQEPDGAWPWLISAATGRALERYPVFTVHQVGMAPLFLVPALEAGIAPAGAALARGAAWVTGANELGLPMFLESPTFMYRSLKRRELFPRPERYVRAIRRARSKDLQQVRPRQRAVLDRRSHTYEWGWLLFAHSEYEGLRRESRPKQRVAGFVDRQAERQI